MKYEVLFEKGKYALILRGESMSEYAVVADLDNTNREWNHTLGYCGFGSKWGHSQVDALCTCLEVFRYYTEPDYISRNRIIELATRFKDTLVTADPEAAVECFDEDCDLSEEEKDFFGIDYDEILNANEDDEDELYIDEDEWEE